MEERPSLEEFAVLVADARALIEAERGRGVMDFPREESLSPVAESVPRQRREPVAEPPPPARPVPASNSGVEKQDPIRAGIGSAALGKIREELGDCERCSLSQGRRKIVFGSGNPDADLLIVGEGPGAQEDLQGIPFVGAAGEMLGKMLAHVLGLSRESVYILNVVKCRPNNNRKPTQDEIEACRPFLLQQIEAVNPKVILALGTTAAQALLQTDRGVTALRGAWVNVEGRAVMPTFHPAYLLRKPEHKALVFKDLKALRVRYDELGGQR